MPDQESGGTSRERPGGALSAEEVIDRLQELVDTRPTDGSCPVEWAVPAYFLGDMNALAALSLTRKN